jgi:hypothetical protein
MIHPPRTLKSYASVVYRLIMYIFAMIGLFAIIVYCSLSLKHQPLINKLAAIRHTEVPSVEEVNQAYDPKTGAISDNLMVSTTIAGVKYTFPYNYIGHPIRLDHENELLFRATWPDMAIVHKDAAGSATTPLKEQLNVLFYDAKTTTDTAFRLEATQKLYSPLQPRGEMFGLKFYLASKGLYGLLDVDIANFNKDFSESNKEQYHANLFVDGHAPASLTYIECGGPADSICDEVFNNGGLLYQISFSKAHLSEWRSIKESTIKLLSAWSSQ